MDKAKLMQEEIENKRKLPNDIKQETYKNIFFNIIVGIIIVIYLCTINIIFYKLSNVGFEQSMKYFALGIILVTVGVFEGAYRKESKRLCIIAIELLACSILLLYIPYIYLHTTESVRMICMIFPAVLALYYMIKGFLIYKTREINYQNNLSDVKEILKDNEKTGYLDEESKKTYREKQKNEEKIKQEILEEQEIRKQQKLQKQNQPNKKTNAKKKKKR